MRIETKIKGSDYRTGIYPYEKTCLTVVCFLVGAGIALSGCHLFYKQDVIPDTEIDKTIEMVEKVIYYENGEQRIIDTKSEGGLKIASLLARTLHRINAVQECMWTEEQVQEMREKDKCIELIFQNPTDVKISRWTETVDGEKYQVLNDIRHPLFILKDSSYECEEATILVDYESGGNIYYGGMSTIQGNKKDKSWIDNLDRLISELP
jgi:hypothetical protein